VKARKGVVWRKKGEVGRWEEDGMGAKGGKAVLSEGRKWRRRRGRDRGRSWDEPST
jgi:hypothetical protein